MTRVIRLLACTLVCLWIAAGSALSGQRGAEHWVATWATSQTLVRGAELGGGRAGAPPTAVPTASPTAVAPAPTPVAPPAAPTGRGQFPGRRYPIPPALASLNNQTVRMIVRSSVGGRQVRVRLSNAFSGATVAIGAAEIAASRGGMGIVASSSHPLTFSGRRSASLYAGQVLISDPVDLPVAPMSELTISLYLPDEVQSPNSHRFGLRTTYIGAGDQTASPEIARPFTMTQSYYWLAGVDVLAPARTQTIVAFGDSITDGDQSTGDNLGTWPTRLAERLQIEMDGAASYIGVVNAGIAGNRILGDNGSGLARLTHDVLAQPGVTWIILLEGINDISSGARQQNASQPFTADDIIAAYRQVIAHAHVRGIRVAGATLLPFGGSSAYSELGERIRVATNEWIRMGKEFDAVIDFDRALRDPNDPTRLRVEADSPDMLHPGDAGYRLMGDSIDLTIFTGRER